MGSITLWLNQIQAAVYIFLITMLTVQNLSKQYGPQIIFRGASFSLSKGEHTGVVGRNGHGKSTLFRLIIGEEQPDSGEILAPKGYRIGFLTQIIEFSKPTLLEEACEGLPLERKNDEWQAEKILHGLGFRNEDFSRPPSEFSGGFQVRLCLCKVLLSEPDLLLLDEPTNFLDILSIRWLTRFLREWKGELMLISHDRSFMDSVTQSILGIHRSRIRKIPGKTDALYHQIALEEELHEKSRLNFEKQERKMEDFISRFRAKARQANLVQSRIRTLEKMERPEKLDTISSLFFTFRYAPFESKYLLEARDISFSYTGAHPHLIESFSMTIHKADRICIIGKNGKGKTTLLKLLAGQLSPLSGEVKSHPRTRVGIFEQAHTAALHDDLTVEDEITSAMDLPDRKAARNLCGAMMFSGDHALKKISVLSGGEKCRVLMGKLLCSSTNLLLLDEPTHHLDMESCEALSDAVEEFEGASVIVTHNEHLLRRLATRLIVFNRDKLFVFEGLYDDFLEKVGWEDEALPSAASLKAESDEGDKELRGKELRKIRADFFTRRSKVLQPLQKRLELLEKNIQTLEKESRDETERMLVASAKGDVLAAKPLIQSIGEKRARIESLYTELFEKTEEFEHAKAQFEQEERDVIPS